MFRCQICALRPVNDGHDRRRWADARENPDDRARRVPPIEPILRVGACRSRVISEHIRRLALALLALGLLALAPATPAVASSPQTGDASTSTTAESSAPPTVEEQSTTPSQATGPSGSTSTSGGQPTTSSASESPGVQSQAQQQSQEPQPVRESPRSQPVHPHPTVAGAPRTAPGAGVAPGPSALAPPPPPSALSSLTLPGESQQLSFFLNLFRTPPFLLPIYLAAGERYGVPWQVLAAINEVESDYGYDLGRSSAGAEGWMQFMPEEWLAYGVDANGEGVRDPYNPADAIFASARYLAAADVAHNLRGAIYAYNHSSSYVESVMLRARLLAAAPQPLIGGLAAIVAGLFPVEGDGPHTTTAVWTGSPRSGDQAAGSASAPPTTTSPSAPPPQLAATAGTRARTVGGVTIAAAGGARVVAVQNAQVVRTGHSARLGRFIELRDAYGDLYTYAQLGRVLKSYVAPRGSGSTPSERAGRAQAPRSPSAPLRAGAWIASATPIGIVASSALGAQSQFLFEIHPAGAGPIDPRPVLQAWQLLDETRGSPKPGTTPLFGPGASEALIQEIQLIGEPQLETDLLSDPRVRINTCGRADIAAGRVDRRVLSALYFLVASGLTRPCPSCAADTAARHRPRASASTPPATPSRSRRSTAQGSVKARSPNSPHAACSRSRARRRQVRSSVRCACPAAPRRRSAAALRTVWTSASARPCRRTPPAPPRPQPRRQRPRVRLRRRLVRSRSCLARPRA